VKGNLRKQSFYFVISIDDENLLIEESVHEVWHLTRYPLSGIVSPSRTIRKFEPGAISRGMNIVNELLCKNVLLQLIQPTSQLRINVLYLAPFTI
jgi:hypothetical protein